MAKLKVTVAMFHDDEAGGYSVIIPTVPELATMGETVEDAFAMARECLEISLEASLGCTITTWIMSTQGT